MGKLNINNGGVDTNKKMADIDERYGPYTSIEAAEAALGGQGRNTITAGLTVGILTANAGVKEYWYQPNKKSGVLELIPKGGNADNPTEGNFASFDKNGNVVDSGCNEGTFIKGVQKNGTDLTPDANGKVNVTVQDGVTPEIDPTTKHWMIGEEDTEVDAEGKDAYQVAVSQGYEGTKSEWLASLKGEKGDNAVNPFKGWFTTANIPTTGQEGDYCNVSDTSVTPHTVTIYRWSTSQNEFVDTSEVPDTATGETFASSEELNQVAIDDSQLVNPVNTADATQPVLAKAEDVMQLKAKLEGVTASEVKGSTNIDYNGFIVCKTTSSSVAKTYKYDSVVHTVFIPIPQNAKKIRFLGRFVNANTFTTGYAFINAENQQDIENNIIVSSGGNAKDISNYIVELHSWVNNGTADNTEINDVTIPDGATYFCAVYGTGSITQSNFYCYLQSGESVVDKIKKVDDKIEGYYTEELVGIRVPVQDRGYYIYAVNDESTNVLGKIIKYKRVVAYGTANKPNAGNIFSLRKGEKLEITNTRTNIASCRSIAIGFVYTDEDNKNYVCCAGYINPSNYSSKQRGTSTIKFTYDNKIEISDRSNYRLSTIYDIDNVDTDLVYIYVNYANYDSDYDGALKYRCYYADSIRQNVTELMNFEDGAETDIDRLKFQTKEITYTEEEVEVVDSGDNPNVYLDYLVYSTNGGRHASTGNAYIKLNVENKIQVKFLGLYVTQKSNFVTGWAFYSKDVEDESDIAVESSKSEKLSTVIKTGSWDKTSSTITTKEYLVDVPNGAKVMRITCKSINSHVQDFYEKFYAYIYYGDNIESLVKKYSHITEEEDNLGNISAKLALDALVNKPVPIDIETTTEGYDKITSKQKLIMLEKAMQQLYVKWTPNGNIPSKLKVIYPNGRTVSGNHIDYEHYLSGYEFTSIPYSSNNRDYKTVGMDVSMYTYLTAVHNPYSLMYTELIYGKTVDGNYVYQSAYGRKYTNTNGYAYYGTVCCGFTSSVIGASVKYGNSFHKKIADFLGVFRPIAPAGQVNYDQLEVGDIIDDNAHSFVITGIKRDSDGNINGIQIAESSTSTLEYTYANNKKAFGGCKVISYTGSSWKNNFENKVNAHDNGYGIHYKYIPFGYNLDIEDTSDYMQIDLNGLLTSGRIKDSLIIFNDQISYNDDICTIYGDKPCLSKGELFAITYDNGDNTYNTIRVYIMNDSGEYILQDGTNGTQDLCKLIETAETQAYDFFDGLDDFNPFNTNLTKNVLKEHIYIPYDSTKEDLAYGRFLKAGMYKATLYNSSTEAESEPTFWEILNENIEVDKIGYDTYRIKNTFRQSTTTPELDKQTNCVYVYVGISQDDDNGRTCSAYSGRPLEYFETRLGEFIIHPRTLVKDTGYGDDVVDKINGFRIIMKGKYGQAATGVVLFPGIEADSTSPDDIPDSTNNDD